MSVDLEEEDIAYLNAESTSQSDIEEHLSFMIGNGRRKVEVDIRQCNAEERKQFEQAKDKELDQWISNSVFKVVRRTGIPIKRIMSMRWILVWKQTPEGDKKAKARLVAKGFTDPDLLTIRAEAPTLSKIGRHLLLQLACSNKFKLEVCDVSTAFLQGDKKNLTETSTLNPQLI